MSLRVQIRNRWHTQIKVIWRRFIYKEINYKQVDGYRKRKEKDSMALFSVDYIRFWLGSVFFALGESAFFSLTVCHRNVITSRLKGKEEKEASKCQNEEESSRTCCLFKDIGNLSCFHWDIASWIRTLASLFFIPSPTGPNIPTPTKPVLKAWEEGGGRKQVWRNMEEIYYRTTNFASLTVL